MLKVFLPMVSMLLIILCPRSKLWLSGVVFVLAGGLLSCSDVGVEVSNFSWFIFSGVSVPMCVLTFWLGGLALLCSSGALFSSKYGFQTTMVALIICLVFSFASGSMVLFFIFFEISVIPTVGLVVLWGYQPERLMASVYLVVYTIIASLPLLVSISFLYMSQSPTSFSWHVLGGSMSIVCNPLWWLMSTMAFMVKMPVYGLHSWLPKAHVEAPVAGSMMLAGVVLKLGAYGILRFVSIFPMGPCSVLPFLVANALVGACVSSVFCLCTGDVKSLIAYSSISHMGLVLVGAVSGSSVGMAGAVLMLVAHGLVSSLLFSLANMIYEQTHTRSLILVSGMRCLAPILGNWWAGACMMNMGVPPSLNLVGEILMASSIVKVSPVFLSVFMLNVFLVGAFNLHLYMSTQHGSLSFFLMPMRIGVGVNYLTCFLHVVPVFCLMLGGGVVF
uniref:NADH-ubiquinone oxidoreductase chain 4 n=2 Tax=Ampharetidae TaxID=6374 RepID=A0A220T2W8_9ANNE|nr:NADH dehydrogenase subunit 4 [Amphicteis gunneri]ASK49882.1 NADH dehydrogenase subunit 4 [Samytha sexcirrata]